MLLKSSFYSPLHISINQYLNHIYLTEALAKSTLKQINPIGNKVQDKQSLGYP